MIRYIFASIFILSLLAPVRAEEPSAPPGPPYLGVSYYPEVGDDIDRDIAHMKKLGINLVRMGDFNWSCLEPSEGHFDFSLLHRAVDKFTEAGIAIVLCTPSAAPPAWMSEKYPDILRMSEGGQVLGHGSRRQYCPNSERYRKIAVAMANRLAGEFRDSPNVIAWQVDNEFWGRCYCTKCEKAFRAWLRKRFGTIEALNKAWLTVLWSQEYQSFDQVPLPNNQKLSGNHHPSLRAAYLQFLSDSYVDFSNAQAEVLRRRTLRPITTNAHNPIYQNIDLPHLFAKLDLVCTDVYAGPDDLMRYVFDADWMRAMGKKFWLAETSVTHNGGTSVRKGISLAFSPGALRSKMWLIYANGGEQVSFWLWRAHWAGHELEHGSVIYPWGDECANTGEIRTVADELSAHADWLRSTKVKPAAVAMHYGIPSQWQFEATSISRDFEYNSAITGFHKLIAETCISRDVLGASMPVEGYKVVFSPYLPAIDDGLMKRMRDFVEAGGTWVLGPLSACRTGEATAHKDACYGADFENWAGIHVRHRLPQDDVTKLAADGKQFTCGVWCDAYEMRGNNARALVTYKNGPLDGLAAVAECSVGKGRVIFLGTLPEDAWLREFIRKQTMPGEAGYSFDPGVIIAERVTEQGDHAGAIIINTTRTPLTYSYSSTGRKTLPAYAVEFIKE